MENVIEIDLFKKAFSLATQYLKNREQDTILRMNLNSSQLSSEFKILLPETGNNSEYILNLLGKVLLVLKYLDVYIGVSPNSLGPGFMTEGNAFGTRS